MTWISSSGIFSNLSRISEAVSLWPFFDVREGPLEFDLLLRCPAVGAGLVLARLGEDLIDCVVCHLTQPLQFLDLLQVHILLILFEHETGAVPADCSQDFSYQFGETHVNYGSDEVDMAEVAGTFTGPTAAGSTAQAGIDDTQPWIHQPHFNGKTIIVVCICCNDLDHAHLPKLLWRDETEADLTNSLGNRHIST